MLRIYEHMRTGFMGAPGSFERQAIYTAKDRIGQLNETIAECEKERAFWERFLERLNPCPVCAGTGDRIVATGEDSSRRENCPACDGTGMQAHTASP